jgi:hypothetical protein
VALEGLVMLAIELGDLHGSGAAGSIGLYTRMVRNIIKDGAVYCEVLGNGHDKGEVAVDAAAEFRRNRNGVSIKLALDDAERKRVGTTANRRQCRMRKRKRSFEFVERHVSVVRGTTRNADARKTTEIV